MSSKIRVLSDHIINKIAAGEVIENPSSVVKELVENSLDAGATDICVEIQGGGRLLIRVSDNGCGMNSDDALLCLERHATSKLRNVEDIHTLLTMGFRGEAIPSIASISKFNLLTCPSSEKGNEQSGTMVIVDGGKIVSCSPAARAVGTTIEVKSLFFNVPVRKKFLKSPTIDANEILKTLSLIALGFPEIRFQLISDGKTVLTTSQGKASSFIGKLRERVENVLGKDFVENTVLLEGNKGEIRVEGLMGQPSYTRHNRAGQYLFINKRAVVSPVIAYAVKEGFGTSLPNGRFPAFVLHLTINGDLVDVNVHPQKREVRLRQEQLIKELLIKAVRSCLHREVSEDHFTEKTSLFPSIPCQPAEVPQLFPSPFPWLPPSQPSMDVPETWKFQKKTQPAEDAHPPKQAWQFSEIKLESPFSLEQKGYSDKESLAFSQPREQPPRVLGTVPSYIILDTSIPHSFIKGWKGQEGLILVDQRSAHLRVLFDRLSVEQLTKVTQQVLLLPQKFELSPYEAEILKANFSFFDKMGIHIKEFENNHFIIDAVPQFFAKSSMEGYITEVIRDFVSLEKDQADEPTMAQERVKHIAMSMVKKTVPAGKRLAHMEAQSLIDQLVSCQNPYICPLGKPILAQITFDELAKLFQR